MVIKHSIISFFGKPNVGKSTLFNALQKSYYSIISYKPQTTRNWIATQLNFDDEHQSIVIDTPGFHIAHNLLDKYINNEIINVLKQITTGCVIVDISRPIDIEDRKVINKVFSYENIKNRILIINKIDKVSDLSTAKKALLDELNQYHFDHIVEISASNSTNINQIWELLKQDCQYKDIDISLFHEPLDEFTVSEIVRQETLFLLKKEVPYSIYVEINEFKYDNELNSLNIMADIIVEKDSQKAIVIGKGAKMIKQIGINARKKILDIYDCKVNLKLFVKVRKDWRNDERIIRSLYK